MLSFTINIINLETKACLEHHFFKIFISTFPNVTDLVENGDEFHVFIVLHVCCIKMLVLFAGFQFGFVKTGSGFDLVYFVLNLVQRSKLRFALVETKEGKP